MIRALQRDLNFETDSKRQDLWMYPPCLRNANGGGEEVSPNDRYDFKLHLNVGEMIL